MALPKIFGKWEYLKQHRYINAHLLAKLAKEKYFYSKIPLEIFDNIGDDTIHNVKHTLTNNYFNDVITARFYFEQKRLWGLSVTKGVSELIDDKEINNFLTKTLTKYQNYLDDHKTNLKNYLHQSIKNGNIIHNNKKQAQKAR
ncbi:MAG: hypothetical protein IIB02_05820 [Thaumarchaeota archaeon]|nr:hypothetical protein [Nitrososphaerota archaeon]